MSVGMQKAHRLHGFNGPAYYRFEPLLLGSSVQFKLMNL